MSLSDIVSPGPGMCSGSEGRQLSQEELKHNRPPRQRGDATGVASISFSNPNHTMNTAPGHASGAAFSNRCLDLDPQER